MGHSLSNGKSMGGYSVDQPGFNFGLEETLAGTNSIYPMLSVWTLTSTTVLMITRGQILAILKDL